MSAVDRASITTTSFTTRTGLERSRRQAWPGTAKGEKNNGNIIHGHQTCEQPALVSSPFSWHGEEARVFSFYDVTNDGNYGFAASCAEVAGWRPALALLV